MLNLSLSCIIVVFHRSEDHLYIGIFGHAISRQLHYMHVRKDNRVDSIGMDCAPVAQNFQLLDPCSIIHVTTK
jgi:hypothetical protein